MDGRRHTSPETSDDAKAKTPEELKEQEAIVCHDCILSETNAATSVIIAASLGHLCCRAHRAAVWSRLLKLDSEPLSVKSRVDYYLSLLALGPSEKAVHIHSNLTRLFHQSPSAALSRCGRILNALVHHIGLKGLPIARLLSFYAVICFALAEHLPEVSCFFATLKLLGSSCFTYFLPGSPGATVGFQLMDRALEELDPELAGHLSTYRCSASYSSGVALMCLAMDPASTDSACATLDFLLAAGCHWALMLCVARTIVIRTRLLSSQRPHRLFDYRVPHRPRVPTRIAIHTALALWPRLSRELRELIELHCANQVVVENLLARSRSGL